MKKKRKKIMKRKKYEKKQKKKNQCKPILKIYQLKAYKTGLNRSIESY